MSNAQRKLEAATRKSWNAFDRALLAAAAGSRFEVGAGHNDPIGWCPYYMLGGERAFVRPAVALGMVARFNRLKSVPRWRISLATVADMLGHFKAAAEDCIRKNDVGEKPSLTSMPSQGHA